MICKLAVVFIAFLATCSANHRLPREGASFTVVNEVSVDNEGKNVNCMCTKYVIYCEQNRQNRPYYLKAAALCRSLSVLPGGPRGRLAVLRDPLIAKEVRDTIMSKKLNARSCVKYYGFWIGLSDAASEGEFIWADGKSLCVGDHRDWAPDEPNNNTKRTKRGQDCVQMWFRYDYPGLLDDEYCDARPKGIVCEVQDPYCHSYRP
uniref:PfG6 protein n=1 Tax=Ptychodera flava TaxID=63121 RepID=Q9U8Q6_PTYFL|nr:PfG6 [Ptychodera flava]